MEQQNSIFRISLLQNTLHQAIPHTALLNPTIVHSVACGGGVARGDSVACGCVVACGSVVARDDGVVCGKVNK